MAKASYKTESILCPHKGCKKVWTGTWDRKDTLRRCIHCGRTHERRAAVEKEVHEEDPLD